MAEMEYMPFFVADWLLDTEDLSPDAYRAYHMLLCKMWLTRSNALPYDDRILRNRCGISPQKWPSVWAEIEHYFNLEENQVRSKKLDKVRSRAAATLYAKSRGGRKGAEAKWRKTKGRGDGKANGTANGTPYGMKNKTFIDNKGGDGFFDLGGGKRISELTVKAIKEGRRYLLTNLTAQTARAMIDAELVTEDECIKAGVPI